MSQNHAMRWLKFFDAGEAKSFGHDLASFVITELDRGKDAKDSRYKVKAEKALAKAARRVQDFRAVHRLNFYQKSRLVNSFLWTLKDGGCAPDFADELTEWLTLRL